MVVITRCQYCTHLQAPAEALTHVRQSIAATSRMREVVTQT